MEQLREEGEGEGKTTGGGTEDAFAKLSGGKVDAAPNGHATEGDTTVLTNGHAVNGSAKEEVDAPILHDATPTRDLDAEDDKVGDPAVVNGTFKEESNGTILHTAATDNAKANGAPPNSMTNGSANGHLVAGAA